jgi:penicillin-insensitive murein endopeptidase
MRNFCDSNRINPRKTPDLRVLPAAVDAIVRPVRLVSFAALVALACACSGSGTRPADRAAVAATPAPVPLAEAPAPVPRSPSSFTDAEIAERAEKDPASLGPLSIGLPNRGALLNAVPMPEDPAWHIVDPANSYGTPEAIASITSAVNQVTLAYPESPPLYVGHLSAPTGGKLRPHKSHQSGRDVDLGYYYRGGGKWYARANARNLDVERTWALVKAFAEDPNVEAIFMDRSVQFLLRSHARKRGEDARFVDSLFAKHRRDWTRLVHHEWGHLTHLHVRFKSTATSELGYRAHTPLLALGRIPAKRYY